MTSPKIAALLFENVVPVELREMIPVKGGDEPTLNDLLRSLLPPSLVDSGTPTGIRKGMTGYVAHYLSTFPGIVGIRELPDGETLEERARQNFPELMDSLHQVLASTTEPIGQVVGLPTLDVPTTNEEDPSVIIEGLKVIDPSRLTWRQILEFRQDEKSKQKLRNLRLFLYDNYDGKSLQYVQDSIRQKIEQYDQTTQAWGMETIDSAFEVVFSSKSLIALTAAGLVAAFTAAPVVGGTVGAGLVLSAAVGSTFTLGKVTLGVRKKRRELRKFRENDPVSYLVHIRDSISNKHG